MLSLGSDKQRHLLVYFQNVYNSQPRLGQGQGSSIGWLGPSILSHHLPPPSVCVSEIHQDPEPGLTLSHRVRAFLKYSVYLFI